MKLTPDTLAALAHGAVGVENKQGSVRFCRFTEAEMKFYEACGNEGFRLKSFTSAGVKLMFQTDSTSLFLKIDVPFVTSRSYFAVDVCADRRLVGSINNYDGLDLSGNYTRRSYPIGRFEKSFDLGNGVKTVTVFLPWSVPAFIEELSLDDGALVKPMPCEKKMLVLGDSISQGYDALHPSKHFTMRLSDALGVDIYNKSIGGETFVPRLVEVGEEFAPELILVAYGTNDWMFCEADVFREKCRAFYETLSRKYPTSSIIALTPIWRKDYANAHHCGDFSEIAAFIETVTAPLENVSCIHGFDLVPHDEDLYGDLELHPNDDGFAFYANGILDAVKEILEKRS